MAIWWNEARGKYEYDWEDAAKVRHRGYARTKGEAERLRAGKMVEASKATELLGDPEQTVADFANQWLKRLKNSDLKPSTIDSYSRLYNRHIAAVIGPIRLRDLRTYPYKGVPERETRADLSYGWDQEALEKYGSAYPRDSFGDTRRGPGR